MDLSLIVANWRRIVAMAHGAQTAAVVKANAYGLGADQCGRALAKAGCRRFYVAWECEGVALRQALGPDVEIAVFHGPRTSRLHEFLSHGLSPVINSLDQARIWIAASDAPYALHLDTGMSRLGVQASDWASAANLLRDHPPSLLLSHLACPDEPLNPFNNHQRTRFLEGASLWPGVPRSLSATAGVLLGPEFSFDEVRPGIGIFGGGPTAPDGTRPAAAVRLLAHILQLRTIVAGGSVGYGATWRADGERKLATVGLGYADGFLRAASNRGYGVVKGVRVPIVGRVSMDLIVLDVTNANAGLGDAVELFGPNIDLAAQADAMGTIDYELLTRIGDRVTRIYHHGGAS